VVGVVLDVVVEVEVGVEAEAWLKSIGWLLEVACFDVCYVRRPRVYVSEVCLFPLVASLRLRWSWTLG
jgi:hypothetical protein